jgi:hypothetical protein
MIRQEIEMAHVYIAQAQEEAARRGEKFVGYDIGCGPLIQNNPDNEDGQKFRGLLIGVDAWSGSKPDIVANVLELDKVIPANSAHFAVASHLLEDLETPYDGIRQLVRIMKPGGILMLICPHPDHYPHITHPKANPGHRFDILPQTLRGMVKIVLKDRPYDELSFDTLNTNWSYEVIVRLKD